MSDKDCNTCKHETKGISEAPCDTCALNTEPTGWEPKSKRLDDATPDEWTRASRAAMGLNVASVTITTNEANARQVEGDHYKRLTIQTWDYIAANNIGYLEGNVIKYVSRWRDKGGVADLEKARHYLDKLIELQCAKP